MDVLAATGVPNGFALQLCAGVTGVTATSKTGNLWIGGYDSTFTSGTMQYVSIVQEEWFNVNINSISFGGSALTFPSSLNSPQSIIDSGTTQLVFNNQENYNVLLSSLQGGGFVTISSQYSSYTTDFWAGVVSIPSGAYTLNQGSFELTITFEAPGGGSTVINVPFGNVFQVDPLTKSLSFGVGYSTDSQGGTVVGETVFTGYVVFFDRAGSRIGFATGVNCFNTASASGINNYPTGVTSTGTTSPTPSSSKTPTPAPTPTPTPTSSKTPTPTSSKTPTPTPTVQTTPAPTPSSSKTPTATPTPTPTPTPSSARSPTPTPTPTVQTTPAPIGTSGPESSGLLAGDISNILNTHNKYRAAVNPTASNMLEMSWNAQMAALAQSFVNTCPDGDGYYYAPDDYGANIIMAWPTTSVSSVLSSWTSESKYYTYSSNTCKSGEDCSEYLQMITATTDQIGCGKAYCSSLGGQGAGIMFACYYSPAANLGAKPYKSGTSCSACPSGWSCASGGELCAQTSADYGYAGYPGYNQLGEAPTNTTAPASYGSTALVGTVVGVVVAVVVVLIAVGLVGYFMVYKKRTSRNIYGSGAIPAASSASTASLNPLYGKAAPQTASMNDLSQAELGQPGYSSQPALQPRYPLLPPSKTTPLPSPPQPKYAPPPVPKQKFSPSSEN